MKCSSTIGAALRAAMSALETRPGRRAFWALVCIAFVALGFNTVRRAEFPQQVFVPRPNYSSPTLIGEDRDEQAKWRSSEFRGFRSIAWGVLMEGKDPYTNLLDPYTARVHVRAYPPFFAIAFLPFALPWTFAGAGSAWFFLTSFVFALVAAWCCSSWADEAKGCASKMKQGAKGRFGAFALTFILLAPLAFDVMARCESDMVVLLPIAAAFFWLVRGEKRFRAGALLGFAASFKVLPGLFGVYLLCTRQWRALAGMICGGLVCTVLLPLLIWGPQRAWALHLSWYRAVVAPYHSGGAQTFIRDPYRPSNQSLTAGINRLLRPLPFKGDQSDPNVNVVSLPEGAVKLLGKGLQAAIALGLVLLWSLCGRRCQAKGAEILMASVAPGILLLSEVSLTSHHVLLILPLAAVLIRILILHDAAAERWSWVFVVYLLALAGVAIAAVKPYTPLLPATAVLLSACVALALRDRTENAAAPRTAA